MKLAYALVPIVFLSACSQPTPTRGAPDSGSALAASSAPPGAHSLPPSGRTEPIPNTAVVHVPHEGDIDPTHTAQTTIAPCKKGSPAPRSPIRQVPLPPSHAEAAKAFVCVSHDECYFPKMPFYAQTNPNFAFVDLPKALYAADDSKLTGPTTFDKDANHEALILDPTGAKTLDPFYMSWLPYGPVSAKDDGYIGYWYTALCGATAESMALMAALEAKSATSKPRAGSWIETAFLHPQKPDGQGAFPEPLHRDHTTLAPNHRQMTAEQLQRVINLAIREHTSPVGGGGSETIVGLADEFELVNGHSPVQMRKAPHFTVEDITNAVRDRFAMVLGVQEYKAALAPVMNGGKVTQYTLTFTNTDGHFLAVNGFSASAGEPPKILIYDPVYATPVHKIIREVAQTKVTKDGAPVVVSWVNSPTDTSGDSFVNIDYDFPSVTSLSDITDGQQITLVQYVRAIRID